MQNRRIFLALFCVAAFAATGIGQPQVWVNRSAAPPPGSPPPPGMAGVALTAQAPTFEFIAAEPAFMQKTIVGAPYSADAVSETTRVLADGTRIKNSNSSKVYRDGEGRIRREQEFGHIGFWVSDNKESKIQISILDPVAKQSIILSPSEKTARVISIGAIPPPPFPPPPPDAEVGSETQLDVVTTDAEPTASTERSEAVVKMKHALARKVEVISGTKMVTPRELKAGNVSGNFIYQEGLDYRTFDGSDNVTTEDLGEQMIQGVKAAGTKRTTTIPTGAIGNDRPIVSVVEEWFSQDLQVIVQRTVKDPQVGETVYRLDNLNLNEPLKSLFEIPSDYEIKETKPRIERIERKIRRDGE